MHVVQFLGTGIYALLSTCCRQFEENRADAAASCLAAVAARRGNAASDTIQEGARSALRKRALRVLRRAETEAHFGADTVDVTGNKQRAAWAKKAQRGWRARALKSLGIYREEREEQQRMPHNAGFRRRRRKSANK